MEGGRGAAPLFAASVFVTDVATFAFGLGIALAVVAVPLGAVGAVVWHDAHTATCQGWWVACAVGQPFVVFLLTLAAGLLGLLAVVLLAVGVVLIVLHRPRAPPTP